jgi:hypothetical protein
VARAVMMANRVAVRAPSGLTVRKERLLRLPSAFVPPRRLTALHRLRKQENNHAATSTQKIS